MVPTARPAAARALVLLALAASPAATTPAAVAPAASNTWAVIAVGSAGFDNYRHQADACHAYQILRKSGVPEDHIVLMMNDDVATDKVNKFPGKLFNKPGNGATDVYAGCKVDYRSANVTAKLFLSVITGDTSGVPAGGKVLRSGSGDRVFLNFVDHGGVGFVCFPNGQPLHASELVSALKTMRSKSMFKELLFYMEACDSGSMFPQLPDNEKIFAMTAANANEVAYAAYCDQTDKVDGQYLGTCLGDLFSANWMEDSEAGGMSTESIQEQVKRVTARTTRSHVMTFGDRSFLGEAIGGFQEAELGAARGVPPAPGANGSAVDIRDIPLRNAYYAWEHAVAAREKALAWQRLQAVVAARAADTELFERIARKACEGLGLGCAYGVGHDARSLQDLECHAALTRAVHEACPRRGDHNAGGWNSFNMQFSQTLVNLCESKERLRKSSTELERLVRSECSAASRAKAAAELVI